MPDTNPVFKEHYEGYLRQLAGLDLARRAPVLGITAHNASSVDVPFFNTRYQVSPAGIADDRGERPDYGLCVILLKYLLLCPQQVPAQTDWVSYRDFKDCGQAQNAGLAAYASQAISRHYTGHLDRLVAAVAALGGKAPQTAYPYDVAVIFTALPRLPMLFLFNDADAQFPAQTSILYERRAAHFLDAECRIMVDWYLLEHLKRAKSQK